MTAEPSEPLDLAALRRDWVELPTLGDLIVRRAAHRPRRRTRSSSPRAARPAPPCSAPRSTRARSLLGLGIGRGDTVAILMPNCLDFVHVLFGCALVGVRALLVNARYKAHELAYVLETRRRGRDRDDGPGLRVRRLRAAPDRGDRRPARRSSRHLILLGASSPDGLPRPRRLRAPPATRVTLEDVRACAQSVRVRDVAILMYTSGTTANPKGCLITHEALVRTADGDRASASGSRRTSGSGIRCRSSTWAACSCCLAHALGRRRVPEHDALRAGRRAAADRRRADARSSTRASRRSPRACSATPTSSAPTSARSARCSTRRRPPSAARDRAADSAGRRADLVRAHRGRRRGRVRPPRRPARRERTDDGRPPVRGDGGADRRSARPDEELPAGEAGQILVRGPRALRRLPQRPGARRPR